jgi:hypothetical protein
MISGDCSCEISQFKKKKNTWKQVAILLFTLMKLTGGGFAFFSNMFIVFINLPTPVVSHREG